jgi:hypothetical protein
MIMNVKRAPCSSFKTLVSRSPRPALNVIVKAKSMYECRRSQNAPANDSVICLLRQSRHGNKDTVHTRTRTRANRNDVIFIYTRRHGDVTPSRPTSRHPDEMEKLALILRPKSTSKKGVNISLKH